MALWRCVVASVVAVDGSGTVAVGALSCGICGMAAAVAGEEVGQSHLGNMFTMFFSSCVSVIVPHGTDTG